MKFDFNLKETVDAGEYFGLPNVGISKVKFNQELLVDLTITELGSDGLKLDLYNITKANQV